MNLQPYQEASEEFVRQSKAPFKFARDVATTATGIGAGSAVIKRVLPFLNKFIPQDMAIKGISKINPTLGKFISTSINQGHAVDDVFSYIKNKATANAGEAQAMEQEELYNQKQQAKKPKENRNVIQQYSPELHQFIAQEVTKGRQPIEAAAIAYNDKRFQSVIKKLEKDNKTPWSNIVEGIYGGGQYGGAVNAQTAQQAIPQPPSQAQNAAAVQSQPQQQQPGQGQQALMAIMQKINQQLGG